MKTHSKQAQKSVGRGELTRLSLPLRGSAEEQPGGITLEQALDDRRCAEAALVREKMLLELVAGGGGLREILEGLCRAIEEVCPGAMAAVLLLDTEGKRLKSGVGPNFPDGFLAEVDGIEIGPNVGSCGTAAYRREQVIVVDIDTDRVWANFLPLARKYGLRAGWSTPIIGREENVLGTFALYWREPRSADQKHLQIINRFTHLASVALELERSAEALRASEKLSRGQAKALSLALEALAKETNPDRSLEHVLRAVTAQLGAHSCSVWLMDGASGLMVFEFALENGKFMTKSEAALAAVSPSLPVSAIQPWPEIFHTGKPVVVEDVREGPNVPWRAHLLTLGIVTILVVPILIASKVEGVIGVRFTQKRAFRLEEMDLAQSLTNQAMLAIQLSRLSAQSRETAVIEERNRMARDVHDALAQGFTGVIMHLEAAEEVMSRGKMDILSSHLRGAGETAREGLREARRSVQALRPMVLEDKKLGEALKGMIDKMTVGTSVRAEFAFHGEPRELVPELEANILRVAQEVLTNVLRHAGATRFNVVLAYDDFEVRLRLQDNGCGFDLRKKHNGFGMQGMRERVESMGGLLFFQSATGQGTVVLLTVQSKSSYSLERS